MKSFIFVTSEGYTFQPDSTSIEPDIENLQVLGFASGETAEQAFKNLLDENPWLIATSFYEAQCLELAHIDYQKYGEVFYIKPDMQLGSC